MTRSPASTGSTPGDPTPAGSLSTGPAPAGSASAIPGHAGSRTGTPARSARTRDAAHFARLYAASSDPWGFRTSGYERDKYAETLAALPAHRFRSALEVGCSIGELTRRLAPRCDRLLGLDLSDAALREAAAACAGLAGVAFRQATVPADWPDGPFDLVVLSEVLYFLVPDDLAVLARRCLDSLDPGGIVLLVDWTGPTDDPLSGDDAADLFIAHAAPSLRPVRQDRRPGYRLDLLGG